MKQAGLVMLGVGGLLFVIGLIDLFGSFGGFDLWGTMGIHLPGVLWEYSAYIEILAGGALIQQGRSRMGGGSDE